MISMSSQPSTTDRCRILLRHWRNNFFLTNREQSQLAGEIINLDKQINRLEEKRIRIAIFGRVGVGKSSLANALIGSQIFATNVAHGSTRRLQAVTWEQPIIGLGKIELLDTPGIDEIAPLGRSRLAARVALQSDLVLLVLDSDLTSVESIALQKLLLSGKPILLVINRADQWSKIEQAALVESIRRRLPPQARKLKLHVVSAAPRQPKVQIDGRVRSYPIPPNIGSLKVALINFLDSQGELLLVLNSLRQADNLYKTVKQRRLSHNKSAAQGLIGSFAALKASGVAANPLIVLDLAGGIACDTALVIQLSNLYGIKMGKGSARQLIKKLSGYSALLGGTQIGIQLLLSVLRQVLLFAAPMSAGLTLAPTAPIAIAQAAIAIHTTKLTGRLAARELFRTDKRNKNQPNCILLHLAASDPKVKRWLREWPVMPINDPRLLQTLLP